MFDDPDAGFIRGVLDTDGDGWAELVFWDGIGRYDADTASYDYTGMIKFPDEIEEECGE